MFKHNRGIRPGAHAAHQRPLWRGVLVVVLALASAGAGQTSLTQAAAARHVFIGIWMDARLGALTSYTATLHLFFIGT